MKTLNLLCLILLLLILLSCGQSSRKDQNLNIELTREAYDSMRAYYSNDSIFNSVLSKGLKSGDTNSIKVRALLTTPFESRNDAGITEDEIKAMILAYRVSKKVMDKFSEIENKLPKGDARSIRRQTDSVLKSLDSLKESLNEIN